MKSFQKGPPPEKAKLKRWWTYLSQFRLTVHHIPGIKNELSLSPHKLHPLLEEKDPKNDRPKNYFFWTFAAHMTQKPPKKYNFTQFAAFFHFLFIKINYYFV